MEIKPTVKLWGYRWVFQYIQYKENSLSTHMMLSMTGWYTPIYTGV